MLMPVLHSVCESDSRRFKPGESLSRGIFHDFEAALLLTAHQQQQMYRPTHSGRHAARWAIFLIDLLHKLYVCNLNI